MFGDLIVNTANLPVNPGDQELLRWSYHVVPIIRLQDDQLYVFDPTLSNIPMKISSFYDAISVSVDGTRPAAKDYKDNVWGKVTCLPNTYSSLWKCFDPHSPAESTKMETTQTMQENLQGFLTQ